MDRVSVAHDGSLAEATLRRLGLSAAGARECLAAEPVALLSDRQRLVPLARQGLDLAAAQPTLAISLIVPAVQSGYIPPRKPPAAPESDDPRIGLRAVGFSPQGAADLIAARPLSDVADRRRLATLVSAPLQSGTPLRRDRVG